jgi:hypothetical protein
VKGSPWRSLPDLSAEALAKVEALREGWDPNSLGCVLSCVQRLEVKPLHLDCISTAKPVVRKKYFPGMIVFWRQIAR